MLLGCLIMALMASETQSVGIDFAEGVNREMWVRHPVWGDPSFDAFERMPGNPILRGAPPFEWPVNGFLFKDPPSGDWFVYVGVYSEGYAINPETPMHCVIYRSQDDGKTWEEMGEALPLGTHVYEGEVSPLQHAPDVSVVYDDGRYHMVFDWLTRNTTWANAANPDPDSNSGVGYAWSDRPEGPFHVTPRPLATTREQEPLAGKYRRLYASSLIRRTNDWLVLTLTDSGPYFGWALAGMTAEKPEGPYTDLELLLQPESDGYHPPLLEFFPAFVHDNHVYMPATSVARNRNFQGMFRAPIEEAHTAAAWKLIQHGSVWHAAPVENEHHGLWGQAFSGVVGDDGQFMVMFPSRGTNGMGTINLARRPWAQPYRDHGFTVSGHGGSSLVRTKDQGVPEQIELSMTYRGYVALLWDMQGPMGSDAPRSDASLHARMQRDYRILEFTPNGWKLASVDNKGERSEIADGSFEFSISELTASILWQNDEAMLTINGIDRWQGELDPGGGAFGLYLGPFSHAEVDQFVIKGQLEPARLSLLYTEALLGAAQGFVAWDQAHDEYFRFAEGAVSHPNSPAKAKWNFDGLGFTLWAPCGPEYGEADIFLDGEFIETVDFHADSLVKSHPVLERNGLDGRFHALIIRPRDGAIFPLDSLDAR